MHTAGLSLVHFVFLPVCVSTAGY